MKNFLSKEHLTLKIPILQIYLCVNSPPFHHAGGCGGQFTDDVGIIASPPHPEGYPHGVHCVYAIAVTDGFVIRLTFNSFSLEQGTGCVYDYVQIYDNSTNAVSPDMGR